MLIRFNELSSVPSSTQGAKTKSIIRPFSLLCFGLMNSDEGIFCFVFVFFSVFSALDVFSRRVITSVKAFAVPANTKAREKKNDAFSFLLLPKKEK